MRAGKRGKIATRERGPPSDRVVSAAPGCVCDLFVQLCENRAAIAYTIGGHLDLCQQNRGMSPVNRTYDLAQLLNSFAAACPDALQLDLRRGREKREFKAQSGEKR
jgi:hypothetical protein